MADRKNSITVVVVISDKKLDNNFACAAFSTEPKLKTFLQNDLRNIFELSKSLISPPQMPPSTPSSL